MTTGFFATAFLIGFLADFLVTFFAAVFFAASGADDAADTFIPSVSNATIAADPVKPRLRSLILTPITAGFMTEAIVSHPR